MQIVTKLLIAFLLISNVMLYAQGEDCGDAIELSDPSSYCSPSNAYTNIGALPSTISLPTCWGSSTTDDVWFKFTAVGTDVQLTIITGGVNGTLKTPSIALYSGSCSGLSELACSKEIATNNNSLYKNILSVGTAYLVRIATVTANCGTFKLCISNYTPTITPGADCDAGARLCSKSEIKVGALNGGGKNNLEIETSSCFNTPGLPNLESNSAWFQWTCDQPGTLTFDIIPNDPTNDLDFILYELSGTSTNACATRSIIRCTATSCPTLNGMVGLNDTCKDVSELTDCDPSNKNSDGFLKFVDMVKSKTYVLMVNNFSAASGYKIAFGGTGTFVDGKPQAVITASGSTACAGENITFSGSSSVNYDKLTWTFSPNAPDAVTGMGPHTVTYSNAGNYTVLLKASKASCTSTSSFNVSILNSPAIPQVLDNVPHCEGDTIGAITAKGGNGTFTWFEDATLTNILHVGPVYTAITTVTDTLYLIETLNGCNSQVLPVIITIIKAIPLPLNEGFEGAVFPPVGWTSDSDPNDTVSFKQNKTVGGFSTSTSCLSFDNYHRDLNGNKRQLNLPVYDFSQTTAPVLAFDVAYVRRDSTHSDSLIIIVSGDCKMRRSYTTLYVKGGKDLATVPADQAGSMFVPTATQWRRETIDMSSFAGESSIQLALQNLGHFGQVIYIDNIHIFEMATGIHDRETVPELIVSPNPVLSDVNINFKTAETMNFTWEISNILGQPIQKESIKNSMGNFNRTIDLSDQPAGIYCLTVTYASKKVIKKLVKQ
jgi:hypothetical protein